MITNLIEVIAPYEADFDDPDYASSPEFQLDPAHLHNIRPALLETSQVMTAVATFLCAQPPQLQSEPEPVPGDANNRPQL